MRFHVLGIGSIGTLVSHHLRLANPDAPISLIAKSARAFPSTRLYPQGKEPNQAIKLAVTRGGHTATTDRFDLEAYNARQPATSTSTSQSSSEDPDAHYGPIRSLVVCLKTPATLSALSRLKHRIRPDSVIALLQNGMGVYDELCAKVWPEPATRPFFLLGTTTHGVTSSGVRGEVIHMSREGEGDIKWGIAPDPRKEVDLEQWVYGTRVSDASILSPPASPALPLPPVPQSPTDLSNVHATLSALLSLAPLNSTLLPMPHLHHVLLLKLALNANINPLTAIIGAGSLPNGALLGSSPSHRLIRMLSTETSAVIAAYLNNLHAPRSAPADTLRLFTREALITRTLALCHATARNTSSMVADASSGKVTEIDHINGFLISLGERLGVPTPHHQMVCEMVKFTAEVTGLQSETAEKRYNNARMARRQRTDARDAEKAGHQQIRMRETDEQERKAQWLETRKSSRRERKRRRKELAKATTVDQQFDHVQSSLSFGSNGEFSGDPSKQASRDEPVPDTETTGAQDSARQATLAQLEALADPSVQHRHTALSPPEREVEPPREVDEDQEEQDEAIKAIESRILGGFGGSRRRRGF